MIDASLSLILPLFAWCQRQINIYIYNILYIFIYMYIIYNILQTVIQEQNKQWDVM